VKAPHFHHIGVQTADLDNSLRWYQDFFGASRSWSLTTFSDLTHSRLPGIVGLTEVVLGDVRIHLFERPGQQAAEPGTSVVQFQHVCLSVESRAELRDWHEKWTELHESGRYRFQFAEAATDIVEDADGTQSFYALDVNGLEFEFTHVPNGVR
jgi:catechol 2,3-dioxygenase-like lactoylglutathione lyase family enzyme